MVIDAELTVAWQRNLVITTAKPRNLQHITEINERLNPQHTYKYRTKKTRNEVETKKKIELFIDNIRRINTVSIDFLNDLSELCIRSHLQYSQGLLFG